MPVDNWYGLCNMAKVNMTLKPILIRQNDTTA
ncbi:MAG: hypothetical protein K0S09_3243 [Sphingobacteriaceae bacterium]|jgi:hypothetical protein|nr:hypothetical protein [Sphingobacteriaceae bacterium]